MQDRDLSPPADVLDCNLMLADSAQVHQGKLFALGAGLGAVAISPASAVALAICGTIVVPWNENHREHVLEIDLIDLDGAPYLVPTPMGEKPFQIELRFTSAAMVFMPRGSVTSVPVALSFIVPARLGSYRFRARLDGTERPDVRLPLTFIPSPGS